MIAVNKQLMLSILGEGFAWALTFIVLIELLVLKAVTAKLQRGKIWKLLLAEKGVMGPDLAHDVVQMFGFGIQHFFAGMLIVYGAMHGNLNLVRNGLLCEWGFEAKDYLNVITRTGPYRDGRVSESYRASMKFHHLPGITSAVPIVYFGLHANVHVQRIGAMMILVGGIGVLSNVARLVLKFGFHANEKLMYVFGIVDIFFCFGFFRFLIFPIEVSLLLKDLVATGHYIVFLLILAGFTMMMIFNRKIFFLKLGKLHEEKPTPGATPKLLKRQSSSCHPTVGDVMD